MAENINEEHTASNISARQPFSRTTCKKQGCIGGAGSKKERTVGGGRVLRERVRKTYKTRLLP